MIFRQWNHIHYEKKKFFFSNGCINIQNWWSYCFLFQGIVYKGEGDFDFVKLFFGLNIYLYTKCVFICCVPHKLINDLHLLICATAKDSKYNWDFENKLNWEFFMIIIILFLYKVSMLYNNDRKKYIYQYILTSENNSNHNFDQKKKYIVIFLSIIHILII